jgi:hypothetical protein
VVHLLAVYKMSGENGKAEAEKRPGQAPNRGSASSAGQGKKRKKKKTEKCGDAVTGGAKIATRGGQKVVAVLSKTTSGGIGRRMGLEKYF